MELDTEELDTDLDKKGSRKAPFSFLPATIFNLGYHPLHACSFAAPVSFRTILLLEL